MSAPEPRRQRRVQLPAEAGPVALVEVPLLARWGGATARSTRELNTKRDAQMVGGEAILDAPVCNKPRGVLGRERKVEDGVALAAGPVAGGNLVVVHQNEASVVDHVDGRIAERVVCGVTKCGRTGVEVTDDEHASIGLADVLERGVEKRELAELGRRDVGGAYERAWTVALEELDPHVLALLCAEIVAWPESNRGAHKKTHAPATPVLSGATNPRPSSRRGENTAAMWVSTVITAKTSLRKSDNVTRIYTAPI